MDPVAFTIFGKAVYWYGIFFALGFLAATIHWTLTARRRGWASQAGSDLGFWIIIGGVLGARTAYVIANWRTFAQYPADILRIDQGGLIYYGGFLGAIVAVIVYARFRKQPMWEMGDLAVSGLPLGHAFGRVGCFINACCYGSETGCAVATHAHGALRHPVQLYEAALNIVLYGMLFLHYRRRQNPGSVLALYLITYPVMRFCMEYFRGDPRAAGMVFNRSQELSLLLLTAGILLWIFIRRKGHASQADG